MAELVLTDCKFWFDKYDFSGSMNALAINYSADMHDNTAFGDGTHKMLGGLKSVTMGHEGYFNAGTDQVDPTFFDNIAVTNKPITICPLTGADGEKAFMLNSILGEYSPGASVGEVFAFSVSAEASESGLIRGTIMHNATRSSSGNGTARQLGDTSLGKTLYVATHVLSAAGVGPFLDIVIQSDDTSGFASPTDRITMSTISSAQSVWSTFSDSTTDDWWRVNYTIGGAAPSFEFVVAIGLI